MGVGAGDDGIINVRIGWDHFSDIHHIVMPEANGIELHYRLAKSDRETLYLFTRLASDIDGFWLFPDNRILSGRVLQEMLDDANRQQVPVTVPSESMLKLGASLSITTVAEDIARTIVKVIREIKCAAQSIPSVREPVAWGPGVCSSQVRLLFAVSSLSKNA